MRATALTVASAISFALPSLSSAGEPDPAAMEALPEVPWVKVRADMRPRDAIERELGVSADDPRLPPIRRVGDMVATPMSMTDETLDSLGLPKRAVDHPPTPGILYLEVNGITLENNCAGDGYSHAAKNCSALVNGATTFPAAGGSVGANVYQALSVYYQDFDLVLTVNRPPDWLPYTMGVIGGSPSLIGAGGGVCGIALIGCDGAKRNHVSLSFSQACGGSIADVTAQESAHNWGLEHTNNANDLMYPSVTGGTNSFVDQCMPIATTSSNSEVFCGSVHEYYCPAGAGMQQNSHGELLGIFGARSNDMVAPVATLSPPDGTTIRPDQSVLISAMVEENSNFVGVKWTWVGGVPAEYETRGFTACTNDMCSPLGFDAWREATGPWDFLSLDGPPEGDYTFKFEVMDAYGNSDTKSITVHVTVDGVPPGESGDSGSADSGSADSGSTTATSTTTGSGSGEAGSGSGEAGSGEAGSGEAGDEGPGTDSDTVGGTPGGEKGCGCAAVPAAWLPSLLGIGLAARRRRRARS